MNILLAGPTASGKTSLAVALASRLDAVVVNADSMQVYADLNHLSARPKPTEMADVPHYLFGHVAPDTRYSVGLWLQDVEALLKSLGGRRIIFCGGTGLYLEALQQGLTDTPDIPPAVKAQVADLYKKEGHEKFVQYYLELHEKTFAHLSHFDPQRVLRAAEVFSATLRPLVDWHTSHSCPLMPKIHRLVLMPNRELLYRRINRRCEKIFSAAQQEVKALLAQGLSDDLPIMRCIGFRELAALQLGEITPNLAMEKFAQTTRHYAKRQFTWLRHRARYHQEIDQFGDQLAPSEIEKILQKYKRVLNIAHGC